MCVGWACHFLSPSCFFAFSSAAKGLAEGHGGLRGPVLQAPAPPGQRPCQRAGYARAGALHQHFGSSLFPCARRRLRLCGVLVRYGQSRTHCRGVFPSPRVAELVPCRRQSRRIMGDISSEAISLLCFAATVLCTLWESSAWYFSCCCCLAYNVEITWHPLSV